MADSPIHSIRHTARARAFSGFALVVLLTVLFFGSARAEPDLHSGNYMLPHCIHFTETNYPAEVWVGQCSGVIGALTFIGTLLNEQYRFCVPKKVTPVQAGKVVVNYMNAHPELLHLDFGCWR